MENVYYPKELIFPDSNINISFDDSLEVNKTKTAIIIEGNRFGFLSLAHLINIYSVYLYDPIVITDFHFVKASFVVEIAEDPISIFPNGKIIKVKEDSFNWQISETNLFVSIGLLHSLGYANDELHLDEGLQPNDISIYCVVK